MNKIRWTVPSDHPAFPGHFPGRPILPGVVLIDQAMRLAPLAAGQAIRGLASAKFFQPVPPGAELVFRFAPATARGMGFEIRLGETTVASGSFTFGAAP
ncbi:hypothetical protein [Zoogloea sp.]|uniref:hypothetical protein n=1 Tax=Zoogloea sp. TaxID=49181 RepID=UPI00263286AA|nr:hypothetical protein [Zoogloea sp.]